MGRGSSGSLIVLGVVAATVAFVPAALSLVRGTSDVDSEQHMLHIKHRLTPHASSSAAVAIVQAKLR